MARGSESQFVLDWDDDDNLFNAGEAEASISKTLKNDQGDQEPSYTEGNKACEKDDAVSDEKQMASVPCGAIVVPACISGRFRDALSGGRESWLIGKRELTHYEPNSSEAQTDGVEQKLHALHLNATGAAVIASFESRTDLGDKDAAPEEMDLCEMLGLESDGSPVVIDHSIESSISGRLEFLRGLCADLSSLECTASTQSDGGNIGFRALWLPRLRPESLPCCRTWQGPIFQAWHQLATRLPEPRFTFCELFSGIGGFRIGLEALGGRCVFASELLNKAKQTYMLNFGKQDTITTSDGKIKLRAQPLGDVRTINPGDVPNFDILTAGFPCQSYTCYSASPQGLNCDNGQLFWEVIRFLREKQPAAALLENVPGLVRLNEGKDFELIVSALQEVGYAVSWRLIDARHVVPQKRLRAYIACIRRDLHEMRIRQDRVQVHNKNSRTHESDSVSATPQKSTTLSEVTATSTDAVLNLGRYGGGETPVCGEDIMHWPEPGGYLVSGETDSESKDTSKLKPPTLQEILEVFDGTSAESESYGLSEEQWNRVIQQESDGHNPETASLKLKNRLLDPRSSDWAGALRSSYRCDWKLASQFVVREGRLTPRFLTSRECARLMGFPDSFQFPKSAPNQHSFYKQIGNAVVPGIIEAVCRAILEAIGK